MDRLRYCAPALASELGSDPEHNIATRCLNNCDEQVVAEEISNSNTDGPQLQAVPVVFASNDLRHIDAAGRERSNMAFKVKNFGGKELQKKWHNRTSDSDMRRHLERKGLARDMIWRVVMVTAEHLSRKDYDGIVAFTN